jgi:hypothetical protein
MQHIVKFHFVHKFGASEHFFVLEKSGSEHVMSNYIHKFNKFTFYKDNAGDLL